jgi:hypothetical protein
MIVMFRTKRDKEHLLEKARKMEEYAAMIVDCIEESKSDEEYEERSYRHDDYDERMDSRYGYRRMR